MDIFQTSHLRANIVAWIPMQKTDRVCYLGEEGDVIARKLRGMAGEAVCVRAAGEIPPGAGYDFVISLGSLIWQEARQCFDGLKETGKLILAAENAYGLKYLAGSKENGQGGYFGSVEALGGSAGRTKEELSKALAAAGFAWQKFYYPFPDIYFTMSIYSDDSLPKQGELIDAVGNFNAERLVLFDEARAFDAALSRGRFQEFSNGYLIVAGKDPGSSLVNERGETVSYVKFSNDRGEAHNIRTYVTTSKDGGRHLIKAADSQSSQPQISNLKKIEERLAALYADSRFSVNACMDRGDAAEFAFLSGHTMEEELDRLIGCGEHGKAVERMLEAWEEIRSCKGLRAFERTAEFEAVFGSPKLPDGLTAVPEGDIDMIFSNIMIGEKGEWTLIDYEWSFFFPIPLNFILYRTIRYYAETTEARRALNPAGLYQKAGICEEELAAYEEMERSFQAYVLDGHTPIRSLYQAYGKPAYHVSSMLHVIDGVWRRQALQVYFDRGDGFCESDVATYRSKALDGTFQLEIPVAPDVRRLRIDPGSEACTVKIEALSFAEGQGQGKLLPFVSNGHRMEKDMYLFDTDDPNILLEQMPEGEKTLQLSVRVDSMSLAAAKWLAPRIDLKYRLKRILNK